MHFDGSGGGEGRARRCQRLWRRQRLCIYGSAMAVVMAKAGDVQLWFCDGSGGGEGRGCAIVAFNGRGC
eukprot:12788898-Alexandrium_andersonii.AAC.1